MHSKIIFTLKPEIYLLSAVTTAHYILPPHCALNTLYTILDVHILIQEYKNQ